MKFGVWALFTETIAYCFRAWRPLIQFGGIPFVVVTLTSLLQPHFVGSAATTSQKVIGALLMTSQLLICVPMIVSWYRMIVLGKEEAARRPMFTFGRRETRLLGWQVAIMLIGLAGFAIAAAILAVIYYLGGGSLMATTLCFILGIAALFAILAGINRLSFVFVLATTDKPVSLRASWDMSRGMSWPLLWTLVLLVLAESLVVSVTTPLGGVAAALSLSAVTVFTFTAMATLFAKVYLRIVAGPAAEATPPPAFAAPEPATPGPETLA